MKRISSKNLYFLRWLWMLVAIYFFFAITRDILFSTAMNGSFFVRLAMGFGVLVLLGVNLCILFLKGEISVGIDGDNLVVVNGKSAERISRERIKHIDYDDAENYVGAHVHSLWLVRITIDPPCFMGDEIEFSLRGLWGKQLKTYEYLIRWWKRLPKEPLK